MTCAPSKFGSAITHDNRTCFLSYFEEVGMMLDDGPFYTLDWKFIELDSIVRSSCLESKEGDERKPRPQPITKVDLRSANPHFSWRSGSGSTITSGRMTAVAPSRVSVRAKLQPSNRVRLRNNFIPHLVFTYLHSLKRV